MTEWEISCILSSRWVPKVGKNLVKLGFIGERAKEVWMTEKQLTHLEALFARTAHGHSSSRMQVIGVFDDRGYYAWCKMEKQPFIAPIQYSLKDLKDE